MSFKNFIYVFTIQDQELTKINISYFYCGVKTIIPY